MKRAGRPALSPVGQRGVDQYEQQLRTQEDLTAATIRNYLDNYRLTKRLGGRLVYADVMKL